MTAELTITTEKQYLNLIQSIGYRKASVLYSKVVPFSSPYWNKNTIENWRDIYWGLDDSQAEQKLYIINKIKAKISNFQDCQDLAILYEKGSKDCELLADTAKKYASSASDWIQIRNWVKSNSKLAILAEQKIKELPKNYSCWRSLMYSAYGNEFTIYDVDFCLEQMIDAVDAKNVGEEYVNALTYASIKQKQRLIQKAIDKFKFQNKSSAQWLSFFEDRFGRSDLKIVALFQAYETAQSKQEYINVLEAVQWWDELDEIKNNCYQKIKEFGLDFKEQESILKKISDTCILYKTALNDLMSKAQTLSDWDTIYHFYSKTAEDREAALQKIIQLTN